MKNGDRKNKLAALGAERLADELMTLTMSSDMVNDRVEMLIATPKENIQRFKAKLSGLKRATRFIERHESSAFADSLSHMLDNLQNGVDDPRTGVELVAAFFETDAAIINRCDDSDGSIGIVFRHEARDLFTHYASQCEDDAWLSDLLMRLLSQDDYGVRDCLVDSAGQFLSKDAMLFLARRFWKMAEPEKKQPDDVSYSHHLHAVMSLARQLGDARLYEKARRATWPNLSTACCTDIAQVYFETGDAETALSWIERIHKDDHVMMGERRELLLAIYEKLGKTDKAAEIAWDTFLAYRNTERLDELCRIIGEDQRERIVAEQAKQIFQSERLSYTDVMFLLDMERIDEAENCILKHAGQLDGNSYTYLVPLAKQMERYDRWMAAALIYRALLESILERAISKYYTHGVRYLKKLDCISPKITDWQGMPSHSEYKETIGKEHFRKKAFWGRYGEKP
jgi:tetratricopeptide (TPR) repeat protein